MVLTEPWDSISRILRLGCGALLEGNPISSYVLAGLLVVMAESRGGLTEAPLPLSGPVRG